MQLSRFRSTLAPDKKARGNLRRVNQGPRSNFEIGVGGGRERVVIRYGGGGGGGTRHIFIQLFKILKMLGEQVLPPAPRPLVLAALSLFMRKDRSTSPIRQQHCCNIRTSKINAVLAGKVRCVHTRLA